MGNRPSTTLLLRSSRDGRTRTDDTVLPRPTLRVGARWDSRFPTSRQSERQDLNLRSRGPRPRAITRLRYVLIFSSPCGSRTQPARLERPMTSPEVERAVLCAYADRKWAGRRSNPRMRFFRPPLYRLSYQPMLLWCRHEKNPMPCDTGLWLIPCRIDQASQAQRHRGQRVRRLIIGKRPCAFWFAGDT